ncbi:MAG: hypothetical protein KIT84_14285 [Labilithrix sp.]|nr:hypothetical protein [Labilithrix sp.]MCW5812190.1 hypothetical protein [Labilithrix sp.]
MNATRLLGALCATILASSIGTSLVACSAPEKEPVSTAQATSAASVSISLLDSNGNKVGTASGVLLAPRLVLTAGHAISGKGKWEITSADGKTKVTGSRGMTYDWMTYDSTLAHPRRHDVGVIHLDAPIKLDAYPKLVAGKPVNGLEATRVRHTGAKFDHVSVFLNKVKTTPNNLLGEMKGGETLDTGGAVYNDEGIIGVVSGRGLTTGKLYVARTDKLSTWLSAKVACAGGTAKATYAVGADKSQEICDENGNPIGGSSNASSSGGANDGSSTNGGDTGGSCEENNDGVCSGQCGGINKTTDGDNGGPNGNTDGDDGRDGANTGTSSSSGSSGSSGSNPNQGGDNGGPNGNSSATGSGGPNGGGGDANSDGVGSSGSNPNQGSSSSSGGGESASATASAGNDNDTNGGRTGGAVDDEEACQGPSDDPEVCPPEPDGCTGSQCGGGIPDQNISYGACGCDGARSRSDADVR